MTTPSPRGSLARRLIAFIRSPFSRASDRDLDDELRAYVEDRTRTHEAAGATPAAARRAALIEIGGVERIKEQTRNIYPGHHLRIFWRDLVIGVRALRRAPAFATVVVATLALGVGASVTMFSVMHAVMWRALPYPDAGRLVVIDASVGPIQGDGVSPGAVLALRASSRMFGSFAMANGAEAFLSVGDEMERVSSLSATDDMLAVLGGVPLVLGRPLTAAVDIQNDTAVGVVISHRLWQRVFRGAPDVLGRRVEINNRDREIVGVLPADLRVWLPAAAGVEEDVDVWFPNPIENRGRDNSRPAIAKLAAGVSLAQGQAELDVLARQLMADHPEWYAGGLGDSALRLRARPLRDVVAAPVERGLVALGAAVGFVFLIGCVNIANLMFARSKSRERDIAVRAALGASRLRIVRQLITEDVVLAAAGTAAGLIVARGSIALITWLRPVNLPRQSEIEIDATVALVAVGLSIGATLVCGLLPALRLARGRGVLPLMSLRSPGAAAGGRRLQRTLAIAEVALSIVPLVAAGLMLRTFVNLSQAPIGFDPSSILTANIGYSYSKFPDVSFTWPLHRDAVAAVRRLPGVESVSAASPLPLAPRQVTMRFRRDGDPTDQGYPATRQTILPGYLNVMRVPLLHGRDFTDDDITARRDVAIVDERFARALWDGDGIGQRFRMGSGPTLRVLEVIGVTHAIRVTRVRDDALPHVFLPYHVSPYGMSLVVKTHGDMTMLAPAIKSAVEALGTRRAVWGIRPMSGYVDDSLAETRFTMLLLTAFAAVSLLLAAVGLYGTLAYLISQRTQEFGVRLALGASTRQVVGLVAAEGALLTGVGAALGIVGAVVVARTLRGLLYGVSDVDGATLAAVTAVTAIVAVIAVSRPAWRAAHVDPNIVLRGE